MNKSTVRIEAPKTVGHDIEFFLQSNTAKYVACEPHIHNAVEMIYVKEGSYLVYLDESEQELTQGDLILFRSNTVHRMVTQNQPQNSYYVIKIPPSFFLSLSGGESGVKYSMHFAFNRKEYKYLWKKEELEGSALQAALNALTQAHVSNAYAAELTEKLKIMEIMVEILRECHCDELPIDSHSASLVYNVISYVQKSYADDIDEKELSKSFGMSYSYFSRTFKRITGISFKSYLNRIRISNAERMLFSTGRSVSEIATACGYNSISYFISVYRSIMGITPYKALRNATGNTNA